MAEGNRETSEHIVAGLLLANWRVLGVFVGYVAFVLALRWVSRAVARHRAEDLLAGRRNAVGEEERD